MGFARGDHFMPLVPWNFWYYPFSASLPDKTAYASPYVDPLGKYEQAFGVAGALAWEEQHHGDPEGTLPGWAGHCHSAAPASILFERPPEDGVEHNGVKFTCEELKFLAAEFYGNYGLTLLTWHLPGKGTPPRGGFFHEHKPSKNPKRFAKAEVLIGFLDAMRTWIRDEGKALSMDLRDDRGEDHAAVWTQAVYGYIMRYWQPRASDLRVVEAEMELFANQDRWAHGDDSGMPASLTSTDDGKIVPVPTTTGREQLLRFRLRFLASGQMEKTARDNLWRSATALPNRQLKTETDTFAPRFAHVVEKPWPLPHPEATGNPKIERAHVLKLLRLRKAFR